ncbi:MAG TPA: MarR family transcriptional regulator [Acidimicrobiales bacterium]|nr:MarR family transcriptional regulator [Acidimicrobiales bacterium]
MGSDAEPMDVSPPERLWQLPSWLLSQVAWDSYRLVLDAFGSPAGRTDYAVLAGLEQFGPTSQATLGRRLGIDRSDIVAVLNRLQSDKLVFRTQDKTDRRRNVIKVTPAGKGHLRRLDTVVKGAQDALLVALSHRQRQQLMTLLQSLVEHHRGYRRQLDHPEE